VPIENGPLGLGNIGTDTTNGKRIAITIQSTSKDFPLVPIEILFFNLIRKNKYPNNPYAGTICMRYPSVER
jgi:hypothetical protein